MPRDRVFAAALAVSLLFHLSAVTVFSIVVVFPRQRPESMALSIVRPEGWRGRFTFDLDGGDSAKTARLNVGDLKLGDETPARLAPPSVELPTLRFAELDRLSVREQSVTLQSRYDMLLQRRPRDSWAWFGDELGRLGSALSRLSLSWREDRDGNGAPVLAGRPAEGFESYVEWLSGPRDRELIFSPPIEALLNVDPAALGGSIALVFAVDPGGRVVEVMPPVEDEAGLVRSIVRSLWRYRFEQIDAGETPTGVQRGTLIIVRAGDSP